MKPGPVRSMPSSVQRSATVPLRYHFSFPAYDRTPHPFRTYLHNATVSNSKWPLNAEAKYTLKSPPACLTNNAAERALRGIALGRKSWLFAGSDRGDARAAAMYTLIGTAKLNDVDPQAWLADVLGRIADTPQTRLEELLP